MTSNSGAVFFLGTRAHYQVLQQPETRCDVENGNESTETIYQNPSVEQLWSKDNAHDVDNTGNYSSGCSNWAYVSNEQLEITVTDGHEKSSTFLKRRLRRQSETTLCEKDDMRPAQLNVVEEMVTTKSRPGGILGYLTSLARRRPKDNPMEYLRDWNALNTQCSYKDSCRCFECQGSYFECDESDTSDYQEYSHCDKSSEQNEDIEVDEERELFTDQGQGDTASTDMLIDVEEEERPAEDVFDELGLKLEVAAGTPVFLNFLLQHPIHCCIQ